MTDQTPEREEAQTPKEDEATQTPQGTEGEATPEQTTPEAEGSPAPEVDYKKKFSESSAENQRILTEKAELEAKVKELEAQPLPEEGDYSDEGKALRGQITTLESKIDTIQGESAKKDVLIAHPELKEMWSELETFRSHEDNKGMNLKTAAKAFLVENGLLEPTRKGLEKTTGGPREPVSSGMTNEEVAKLRTGNSKAYREMLKKGQLKISQPKQ